MLKNFLRYKTLEEDTSFPRLKFGVRFRNSAYMKEKLHPVLDGFLSFLYRYGEIREIGEIALNQFEDQKKNELLSLVRNGRLSGLDASAYSSYVVLASLKKFLKRLPNCLLWRIRVGEWQRMAYVLPKLCDNQEEKREKLNCCIHKGRTMMNQLKPLNRSFFYMLLATLREISNRSSQPEIAALRLADYFAITIMANKPESSVQQDVKNDLRAALGFLIINALQIFPDATTEFVDELPLCNVIDKAKSEGEIEGAEEAIECCLEEEVFAQSPKL